MLSLEGDRKLARIRLVEEHVQFENLHDLDGVVKTFGETAVYDDESWNEHFNGLNEVRGYYGELMHALPDLSIEVKKRYVTLENIILEAVIRGSHVGSWRGLPGTGRKVEFPLCAIYSFDEHDRLAGERIYYDRATPLRQVGVFNEPDTTLGRLAIMLTHPVTVARVMARRIRN
jgi:steroid delta-isomerase-like uncharacterized protein